MTGAYFVTGTDTGVGKTTVSAAILAAVTARGMRAACLKPAESGCPRDEHGELIAEDALLLRAACGPAADLPLELIAPHRYASPVAPAVAARQEQGPFSLTRVVGVLTALRARQPNLLLVEGAGGLLAPYSDELLGADLCAALDLPLLIIARASLGTINHTLLTIFEARRRRIRIAGVILNRVTEQAGPDEATNAAEIARFSDVPILGTLAHLPGAHRRDLAILAAAAERSLPVATLVTAA